MTMVAKSFMLAVGLLLVCTATAPARTINVGGQEAEFSSIQAAIDAAQAGDLVRVAAGRYRESVDIDKDLDIVGAGSDLTSLESADVVVHYGPSARGRLEGFTIRYLGIEDRPAVLIQGASPLIVNNVVTGATLAGVEIHEQASPILFENRIVDNQGSGVLAYGPALIQMQGNRVERNGRSAVHHAGVEVREGAQALLQFNEILLNGGSGVFAHGASNVQAQGNLIVGNGLHGISIESGSSAQLSHNAIWWNTEVGVRLKDNQSVSLEGNVIARNLLGLVADTDAVAPQQEQNLFLVNVRDTVETGLSLQDAALIQSAFVHPRFVELLMTFERMSPLLSGLHATPAQGSVQELIDLAQLASFIGAQIYAQAGLTPAAEAYYRLVVRLNLNSAVAEQARVALESLGR